MEVKVLGSVSPYAKGECNGVGYLVEDEGKNKVLLDAGSGITRLLNFPEDLNNLIIKISHLHKDHYIELLSLGYATYVYHNLGYLDEKIKVYLPSIDFYRGYEYYHRRTGTGAILMGDVESYDSFFLNNFSDCYLEFLHYDEDTIIEHGDMIITSKKNPHDVNCFNTRIECLDDTLVYSADTGYKDNTLVEFAKKADLLICESTFLKGQNKIKDNHLYAYEAGKIAKDAEVGKLLLTHFWPEIDKELYLKEASEYFYNVDVSEEGEIHKIKKLGGII